eukprot:3843837-Rhodomonas_salina.1
MLAFVPVPVGAPSSQVAVPTFIPLSICIHRKVPYLAHWQRWNVARTFGRGTQQFLEAGVVGFV